MSVISLADAKAFLDVIHSADDAKLQALLNGAEAEALRFLDRPHFSGLCPCDEVSTEPVSDDELPDDVRTGVLTLLQARYQASPDEALKLREIAEQMLFPHRCRLGV